MFEIHGQVTTTQVKRDMEMWNVAEKLEASFLAEMLKATGLGDMHSSFSGGSGEKQFSSFLHQAQAEKMVEVGGIGLSEVFFNALKDMSDADA